MNNGQSFSSKSRIGEVMTGGRAIAEMLNICKVGPIFGMAGFQLLPYYEGVRELGMEHHLVSDERLGAVAADAYARMTGRPGVCDATTGPGATNLVTSLIESLNAGIPVIAIAGDTHRAHSWKNMTQEALQLEILRPAVKELIWIEMIDRITELIRRAFTVATSGRPGPVLTDLPEDISCGEYQFDPNDFYVDERVLSVPSLRTRPDAESVEKAAELLVKAKRPIILVGGGVHLSDAYDELRKFAEGNNIPVANTLSGKGAIACTHDLSVGLFSRYSRIANDLIETSDCIFVVGCKLGEIASKRYTIPNAKIPLIHIDIVAEEIVRWAPASLGLWGDAKASLKELSEIINQKVNDSRTKHMAYLKEIATRKAKWQEEARVRYESKEIPINMGRMMHELNKLMPEDSVLVADGGFAAHWGGLLYDTKKAGRTFVANRGFASIGYGLPASLGVELASKYGGLKGPVVGITGDGGLNMTIGYLETAARAQSEFTLIVVNNAATGYIKALQYSMYGEGHCQSSSLTETDYAELAKNYGCYGIRVEDPDKLADALKQAMSNKGSPTVVDVIVTRNPAQMLPGVDIRMVKVKKGDRPV